MKYRREIEHDYLLIDLVTELDNKGRLDIVAKAFEIEDRLEPLVRAQRRLPFDVELTFRNLSIVIETKVDADEGGRWNEEWQTVSIVNSCESLNYLNPNKRFRFITYGTSEFYTKPYKTGPASSKFKHIRLNDMINLVEYGQRVLSPCENRDEWIGLMRVEQQKRKHASELLKLFSKFRTRYLDIHKENDFPQNCLRFCAPELAFPVLGSLAQQWNNSEHKKSFGRLSLYCVGRMSPPVHDSVLNFLEMWRTKDPALYIEINEDFNLNLKVTNGSEVDRCQLYKRLDRANWPSFVKPCRRNYRQGAVVLYEMDFGFLKELDSMEQVMGNLASTVEVVVEALPEYIWRI